METMLQAIEKPHRKAKLPQIQPGDSVRVHQTIREGSKKRTQVFEGVVIRISRPNEIGARILVRKIASGIGVEKSWMLHSPNVTKIEVVKRTRVRRANLTYLRARRGKSARLSELGFDKLVVNEADDRTHGQIEEETAKEKAEKASGKDEIESIEVVESTEDLVKEENKAASSDEPQNDADETMQGGAEEEDALIAAEEVQEGIDRADK